MSWLLSSFPFAQPWCARAGGSSLAVPWSMTCLPFLVETQPPPVACGGFDPYVKVSLVTPPPLVAAVEIVMLMGRSVEPRRIGPGCLTPANLSPCHPIIDPGEHTCTPLSEVRERHTCEGRGEPRWLQAALCL